MCLPSQLCWGARDRSERNTSSPAGMWGPCMLTSKSFLATHKSILLCVEAILLIASSYYQETCEHCGCKESTGCPEGPSASWPCGGQESSQAPFDSSLPRVPSLQWDGPARQETERPWVLPASPVPPAAHASTATPLCGPRTELG